MNAIEAGELLATCASFDRRTTGPLDAIAWQKVLRDESYADCERAVIEHYRNSEDWLMPARIRRLVHAARAERLRRERQQVPAADPDDVQAYLAALRQADQGIARGDVPGTLAGIARRVLAARPEVTE